MLHTVLVKIDEIFCIVCHHFVCSLRLGSVCTLKLNCTVHCTAKNILLMSTSNSPFIID